MKPTIIQIKEYFKNAKEVKCLYNGDIHEIITNGNIDVYNRDIWYQYDKSLYAMVWHAKKGYAEIISYKDEPIGKTEQLQTPKHYDNSKGSLYKFCENQQLNSYEFDIIKRVMRCRKKGNFKEDLEKTKFLIDLYLKEHEVNQ
jgi:hypothetical protein